MSPTSNRPADGLSWPERGDLRLLNTDMPRIDGPLKVTGRARYSHDMRLPGMLYGRALCCSVARARVQVDLSGVEVPGAFVAIPITEGLTEDGATSWLGQPIAAVAAETPERAEDALRQIRVTLEELPFAVTHDQAVAEGAPEIGEGGNVQRRRERGDRDEAEKALEGCDAVIEAEYRCAVQHHACLETHGVVVDYRGGDEATIYASTQHTNSIPGPAANILGLERENVESVVEHMGGGFGAKFGLDLPDRIACLLSKEAKRPVHLLFTRKDEFLAGGNRSGSIQRLRGGATRDGKLQGLVSDLVRLGGVGFGSNPGQPYIYDVPKSYSEIVSVHTHTDGSRAMRAPGHPQASFAIESLIDELGTRLGLDPVEMRKANLEDPVYHRQLDRVAREIGWAEHPNKTGPPETPGDLAVGIGFGVSTWGGGGRRACVVEVRIANDGSVVASTGSQDIGTGTRTYVAAIVAEEFGLELHQVTARVGRSSYGMANGSGGSVTTASLSPAVKAAAVAAREKMFAELAPVLGAGVDELEVRPGHVAVRGSADAGIPWGRACAALSPQGITAVGEFDEDLQARGVHGAQAAQVEVDTLTGEVRVRKMVFMQDCGLPLNRMALRSQINGGQIQAMSYALFEERVLDPWLGVQLNASFDDYRIAGAPDMPEVVSLIDDEDTRNAVIGIGEPPAIPGASAIANAVFNACGARVRELPITRDKVLAALGRLG